MLRYCLPILLFVFSTAYCADVTADLAIARQHAGYSADDIHTWATQQHDYHLSTDDILRMRDAGVPDDSIKILVERAMPEPQTGPVVDLNAPPMPPAGYDGWWNPDRDRVGTQYDVTIPAEFVTTDMCEGSPNVICTRERDYVGNYSMYGDYGDMNSANEIGIAVHPLIGRGIIVEEWTTHRQCEPLPAVYITETETEASCDTCNTCAKQSTCSSCSRE